MFNSYLFDNFVYFFNCFEFKIKKGGNKEEEKEELLWIPSPKPTTHKDLYTRVFVKKIKW